MQSEWEHVSKWLKKIKTEDEYQSQLKDLETLMDEVGDNLKHPLSEFLDLLAMRVEEYEKQHFPIEDAPPPQGCLKVSNGATGYVSA